jgi:hypothetical protein
MRKNEFVGPILNAARKSGPEGRTLADILKEGPSHDGRIPDHTGAAVIGGALLGLVAENLITISKNSENDVGNELISLGNDLRYFSYEAAIILRKRDEKKLFVRSPSIFLLYKDCSVSV